MKTKLLTACVAAALLAGCGSDGKDPQQQVQAFDGAIQGIAGTYTCTADGVTETGALPKTAYSGFSTVTTTVDSLLFSNPSSCTFTFNPTPGAVDVSNGKSMAEVSLSVPKGLAGTGSKIVATPFSTLVAQKLAEAGADEYNESTAIEVLTDLGLGDVLAANVSPEDILTNLDEVIENLKKDQPELAAKVTATTHILTDVLVKKGEMNTARVAEVAKGLTSSVVEKNPNYPTSVDGKLIVVDAKEAADDLANNPNKKPEEVTDKVVEEEARPVPPPTGTGTGTGTGSGGGSTGD